MSGSLNKVILIGNLGKDPEQRQFPSGDSVVSFTLATSDYWKDKATGEQRSRTEWHNVQVFNENLGRIVMQYCKKGSKVYLEGQIQSRDYTDKDGNQRRVTDIVLQRFQGELKLLDSKNRTGDSQSFGESDSFGGNMSYSGGSSSRAQTGSSAQFIDDEVPF